MALSLTLNLSFVTVVTKFLVQTNLFGSLEPCPEASGPSAALGKSWEPQMPAPIGAQGPLPSWTLPTLVLVSSGLSHGGLTLQSLSSVLWLFLPAGSPQMAR